MDGIIPVLFLLLLFFPTGCAIKGFPTSTNPIWDHPLTENPKAGTILQTRPVQRIEPAAAYAELSEADVVLAGEQHNHPGSHQVQFETLKELHGHHDSIGIGFELFRTTQQNLLDAWSGHAINFETFKKQLKLSESEEDLLNSYRIILRYARKNNLPLRALKPSHETVNEVRESSRNRADSTNEQPLKSPVDPQQKAFLRAQFKQHIPTGRGFETFLAVQHFWEEQMASNVDTFLRNPNTPDRMLVLTGNYHVAHDFGLPAKLRREGPWTIRSLVTLPIDRNLREFFNFPGRKLGDPLLITDLIWWIPPENKVGPNLSS